MHSGDSACVIPAMSLGPEMLRQVEHATEAIALRLGVIGLINIQFAVYGDEELYVIEANPRASRTVPFVSKAIGVPLAKLACRLMLGERLADMQLDIPRAPRHVSVKEAVLPFGRFPRADSLLGPEMKSTGEVMGVAADYPTAFGKAQAAAGAELPRVGHGVHQRHRRRQAGRHADRRRLPRHGLPACSPPAAPPRRSGAWACRSSGSTRSPRARPTWSTGSRPARSTWSSTPRPARARAPTATRSAARRSARGIPCITTLSGASAAQRAIRANRSGETDVVSLQELHGGALAAASCGRSRASVKPAEPRTLGAAGAPHAHVTAVERLGAYRVITALDSGGPPDPQPGQFYMLSSGRAAGAGERRAALPAAGLLLRARAARASSASCSRWSARAPRASPSWARGTGWRWSGRSASASAPPRDGTRPLLVGGGIGTAPLLCLAGRARPGRAASCSASAPRRTRRPPRLFARRARRSPPTTARVGRHGARHRPAARAARRRPGGDRATPAARRRCSRPSAPSAPSRGVPAQLALESGMACGFGACFGCVVPDPRRLRPPVRRRPGPRCGRSSWRRSLAGHGDV